MKDNKKNLTGFKNLLGLKMSLKRQFNCLLAAIAVKILSLQFPNCYRNPSFIAMTDCNE